MNETNVNPDLVINELLDHIKKLSFDNSILKALLVQIQQSQESQVKAKSMGKGGKDDNNI